MNEYNKTNRNNEPKVDDTYKRCMTKAARNTIKESGDGKLKLDDCNVAMEMHKIDQKNAYKKRLEQNEIIRKNLTEY